MVALSLSHFGAPELPGPTRKSKIRCVCFSFSFENGYRGAKSRGTCEEAVYLHGWFPKERDHGFWKLYSDEEGAEWCFSNTVVMSHSHGGGNDPIRRWGECSNCYL